MLRDSCGYKLANDCIETRAIRGWLGHVSITHTTHHGAGSVLADFLDTPAVVEKLWATAMPFNPSTH